MTRTRALYIALVVFGIAAVLALGSKTAFLALYFLLLMPVLAFFSLLLYPKLSGSYFVINRRSFFKGESQKATLRSRNYGVFAYPVVDISLMGELAVFETDHEPGPIALAPFGAEFQNYEITFPFRGVYELGVKTATVTDFLGLFKLRFKGRDSTRVTVYPKLIPGFALPVTQKQLSEGDYGIDRFSDDWADVSDVRRHDPSDDYRKIHWKLSAKRGEFIVKNFRTPGLNKTLVFIDTNPMPLGLRERAELEDTVVSLAASCADFCLKHRQAVRLVYGEQERDGLDLGSPRDMESALDLLAMLPFAGEEGSLSRAVYHALLSRQVFSDIVVFVPRLVPEDCSTLKAAFSAGHNVFLYYVCPEGESPSPDDYAILDEIMNHGITAEIIR